MDEMKAAFAGNLIRLRTAAGMTQAELGEKLHYSDKAVSKWERAESVPDAWVLLELARLFGVTVDDLLHEHSAWTPPATLATEKETYSRRFIILTAIAGIWTLCVVEFALVWALLGSVQWIVFIVGLPLTLIVLLVFDIVWFHGKHSMYLVMGLVLSLLVLIYLLLLKYNFWQFFLILAPAELLVFFGFQIRKPLWKRASTRRRAGETEGRAEKDGGSLPEG